MKRETTWENGGPSLVGEMQEKDHPTLSPFSSPAGSTDSKSESLEMSGETPVVDGADGCLRNKVTPPAQRSSGVTLKLRQPRLSGFSLLKTTAKGWITENDIRCLTWIGEQGTVGIEQLWMGALGGGKTSTSPKFTYKRALFWERVGLIESFRIPNGAPKYLNLTQRGIRTVREVSGRRLPPTPPRRSELAHTLRLTDFRIAAESASRVQSWVPDRCIPLVPNFPLNRLAMFLPDALWVTPSGKRILLEYERTKKTLERRTEKARAFAQEMAREDRFMDFVVWICEDESYAMLQHICLHLPDQRVYRTQEFMGEVSRPLSQKEGV